MSNSRAPGELEGLRRVTQITAASLLGINTRTLRNYTDLPRGAQNLDGSYDLTVLVPWFVERRAMDAALGGADAETRAMFAGAEGSPALERVRNATADLKEMERDEKRGQLVKVSSVSGVLVAVGSRTRSAFESLLKLVGPKGLAEARGVVEEWAEDVGRLVDGEGFGEATGKATGARREATGKRVKAKAKPKAKAKAKGKKR